MVLCSVEKIGNSADLSLSSEYDKDTGVSLDTNPSKNESIFTAAKEKAKSFKIDAKTTGAVLGASVPLLKLAAKSLFSLPTKFNFKHFTISTVVMSAVGYGLGWMADGISNKLKSENNG